MRPRKEVTQGDIASELHTSVVTVSNALSGRRGVSDALRAQIRAKALEMGYQGSVGEKNANGLQMQVLVLSTLSDPLQREKQELTSFLRALQEAGMQTTLLSVPKGKDAFTEQEISALEGETISAIVVYGNSDASYFVKLLESYGGPVVCFEREPDGIPAAEIRDDCFHTVQCGVRLLQELGHTQIAYVRGDRLHKNFARDRYLGFCMALREDLREDRHVSGLDFWKSDRLLTMGTLEERLANGSSVPSALQCEDGRTACDVIRLLQKYGAAVPGDVSVIGYGAPSEEEQEGLPALTYCRPNAQRMYNVCIRVLTGKILRSQNTEGADLYLVPGELFMGQTAEKSNELHHMP